MRRPISVLTIVLLACAAVAEQPDLAPVTSLKVDLEQVVELGTVSAVDGMGSWVRYPDGSRHQPYTLAEGALLYVKEGHLPA